MANLEVIALDTATPQLKAPQAGDGYAMPRPVTVTEVVGSTALTLTGATQTTAVPLLNATQTWNNAAVVFTGIKLNVINTASDVNNSALMDLQVGGTSQYKFKRNGNLEVANGVNCAAGNIQTTANFGLNANGSGVYWRTAQTWLFSDANNALDQRNGTNAQTFRVYNTFTSTTSYERGFLKWNTNVLQIGTEKGSGGGTARALELQTDGTTRVTISTTGQVNLTGGLIAGNFLSAGSASYFEFTARTVFRSPSDGILKISNNAETDFGRLQFGGTTSSFPAIKRSAATFQARLADDSDFAIIDCAQVGTTKAYTVATLPTAGTAGRRAYVTDATAPTFLGTLTGGGTVVCPVFDNGTAWVAG